MKEAISAISALIRRRVEKVIKTEISKLTEDRNRRYFQELSKINEEVEIIRLVNGLIDEKIDKIQGLMKVFSSFISRNEIDLPDINQFNEKARKIVDDYYLKTIQKSNITFKIMRDLTLTEETEHDERLTTKMTLNSNSSNGIVELYNKCYMFKEEYNSFLESILANKKRFSKEVYSYIKTYLSIYLLSKIGHIYNTAKFVVFDNLLILQNNKVRYSDGSELSLLELANSLRDIKQKTIGYKFKFFEMNKAENELLLRKKSKKTTQVDILKAKLIDKLLESESKSKTVGAFSPRKTDYSSKAYRTLYKGDIDVYLGKFHGYGKKISFKNIKEFSIYEGIFNNGMRFGYGWKFEQHLNETEIYFGEFSENVYRGEGEQIVLTYSNQGDFSLILRKGKFDDFFENGIEYKIVVNKNFLYVAVYEGGFVEGFYESNHSRLKESKFKIRKGKYELEFEFEEEVIYKGSFKEGEKQGKGEQTLRNIKTNEKFKYKGNFVADKMEGTGLIEFHDHPLIRNYWGNFKQNNYFIGYGRSTLKNGDIYEGFYGKNGSKDGVGMYLYYNQKTRIHDDVFFGSFYFDRKLGLGIFFNKDKSFLVGKYVDSEKDGKFQLVNYRQNNKVESSSSDTQASNISSNLSYEKVKKEIEFENNVLIENLNCEF